MHTFSLTKLIDGLENKTFSSLELTQHYLNRIQQHKSLNALISVDEEHALKAAKLADSKRKTGDYSPLCGIPVAHKDIFCTSVMPTSCGSKMLANFQAPYQATIVERLEQHGTVMLGKTNMDEFGMGSANENSYFGPVKNPWNQEHVPGGSSGGSAAVVAAGLAPFATASDTGGSIRQPAAFCGISGIKPTYGLVSRYGMIAYASSLEQAGPMAKSAEELAIVLQVLAGFDEKDSTSMNQPIPNYHAALNEPLGKIRIGLPRCFFHSEIDNDIQEAILAAVKYYEQQGATIVHLDLPLQSLWIPSYYVIACAEASSNLSRFDGIRFGHSALHPTSVRDLMTRSRSEGFGAEVKRRILTGTHLLSSNDANNYYVQAQKIRRMIQAELQQALQQVDVILGPTTPACAFKIGEVISDPTQRYLADVFTVAANLAGLPALSIPAGFHSESGLPIGMQLMGSHFSEASLLRIAHYYQRDTAWHLAKSPSYKES